MKEIKNIKELFHGVVCFSRENGYMIPRRFTLEQTNGFTENKFFYDRSRCGASVTLELITSSKSLSFAYKFFLRTGVKSTFEVYVDGFLTHMVNDWEIEDEGRLHFQFEAGKKYIEIYIPNYSEVGIKNFELDGEYQTIEKEIKVLFIGDSITQGGGSERSGQTYVNVVKRALNYEILNQGIGGYYCDKNSVKEIPFVPDKIVVAFGTNHRCFTENAHKDVLKDYFSALNDRYKNLPVLVIFPPFYGAGEAEVVRKHYKRIKDDFMQAVQIYPNMKTVNAYDMIPHFPDYYMNDFVHPNALGMELYGNNLVRAFQEIGF